MSFFKRGLFQGRKWLFLPSLILAMTTLALQPAPLSASPPVAIVKAPPSAAIGIEHVPGEVLVKFRHRPSVSESAAIHARMGAKLVSIIPVINVHRVRAVRGQTAEDLIQAYASRPDVEYVEPNGIVHTLLTPNDPYFSQLYGLHNTGQTGGTADADIDAPEAWDVQTGSSGVIVAGIDTGVDYNHQDLAMNMWTNTGEIPGNGVDDDGNGYIDDVRGWDFVNNDNDPMDDHGHGTHTAGTIAAVGNNGVGVVGVSWQARIMPLKFLDATGEGTFEAAASAIVYSADMGARLSSNSWGCGPSPDCFSQVIEDAIAYANSRDVLFVVAAGNDNNNNDETITYPCVSSQPNVICVAATDHNDQRASFSSYGLITVDIGAPGVDIYSTVPTGNCNLCDASGYRYLDGTSMATPHVAGAAALLLAQFPGLTPVEVKTILMGSSDTISTLFGITVSGGRLNVNNALETHFTVTSDPATQGIMAGESATYTISVNSVNNFNAPVTLELVSPDPTITGSFSVNPVTPPVNGSSSSTLAIYTTGATSRGTYILTVSGIDALGETRSFPITLVVGSPDFTVSVNPSSQPAAPGESRAYTVIISSIDGYSAPVTLSMTTADLNISGSFSPNPVTLPGNGSVTSTLTVTTTPSVPLGNHTLTIEGTDGTKTRTSTATLVVSNVDLIMTTVSGPATVFSCSSITISSTVQNQGTGSSNATLVYLYLSSNATISNADAYLGRYTVPNLAGGASASIDTIVTLPSYLIGTYYIGAVVDPENSQAESNETNNALAGNTIVITSPVDLVMTEVSTASSSVGIGESLTIANTVKNQGPMTPCSSDDLWVIFFLSSDATITISDNLLGSRYISSLGAGASDSANTTVTVPTWIAPDTYYIGAIAYSGNEWPESDETNNALAGGTIVVVRDVDLVMMEVSTTSGSVGIGESLTITNTVKNQGTTTTSSTIYVSFYLSPDATITTSDNKLGSGFIRYISSLGPGVSDSADTTETVPAWIAPGTYYIGAIADANDFQPESDETNNALAGGTIVVVRDVDLVMTAVSTTSSSVGIGESLTIANTVKNQGATATSSLFYVGLYLSSDATITTSDNRVDGDIRFISSLGAGASDSANTTVTVPTWIAPGTYYIGAIADAVNWQPESDETNNALAGNTIVVTPGADLIMTSVSGPISAVAGSNITISDTVKNQGTGSTGGSFNIGLYLSTDSVIAAGDTFLGSRSVSTLSAGETNSGSTTVTIPTGVAPGTYYLGALSDNNNEVAESNEANNSLAGNIIQITQITTPDLLMTGVIPNGTSVRSGGTLSVTDTVQNSGSGSSGAFTIDYHLSSNAIYGDTDDVVITTTRSVSSLTTGTSSTATTNLTIPATTLPGQYYICAMADSGNTSSEGDETNNTLCSSALVFVTAEVRIDQASSGDQRFPWTDYNEATGEYLVLWQDKRNGSNDDIYGVRLDHNGNRIGSDFAVSTASGHQQRVLVKSGGGGYLALWHDLRNAGTNGADIYGAWIDGDGTVGPEVVICACAQHQWNPVAGYDPVSNTFLVVFLSGTGSGTGNDIYDLWGAVIPAGGTGGVTPFTMVTLSGGQRGPQIGYDYGNNQYYMAWNDRRVANYDIYGSRVSTSGTLLDGTGILLSGATGNQFRPTVTDRRPSDGVNNHLVAWTDYRPGTQADLYGIYVDGIGAAVGSEFVISANAADQANVVADVDWINTTKKSLIGFIDKRNGVDYDIYSATVDQAGSVTGDTAIAGQPTGESDEQRAEVVTYTTDGVNDYGFLTVWMDRRNGTDYDIYGIKVWP